MRFASLQRACKSHAKPVGSSALLPCCGGARHSIWAFELRSPGDHVTTVVFVPSPKGLVKETPSRFLCVLGFRRFSDYRNRNNRLTSSQEFSWLFTAGDCADHCRSEYGTAALDDTSSKRGPAKKGVESVGFR